MELSGILTVQTLCVFSYESNFPRQKNLILQKMVLSGEEKVVN